MALTSRAYDHAVVTSVEPVSKLNQAVIDHLSLEETMRIWRFAPAAQFVAGDPLTLYFLNHLAHLAMVNPKDYTRLSADLVY